MRVTTQPRLLARPRGCPKVNGHLLMVVLKDKCHFCRALVTPVSFKEAAVMKEAQLQQQSLFLHLSFILPKALKGNRKGILGNRVCFAFSVCGSMFGRGLAAVPTPSLIFI